MLTVENVSVAYGDREVVKGVSFALENGQWLMLCGPNGAGKSTLVKAIAQSVRWSGRIVLEGRNIRTIRPKELGRMVGVLSQNHQLGYAFTVEEVVALGRYAYGGPLMGRDMEGENHIRQALERTGMENLRRQSMLALSGGEMQRVFLAQVFAQDPALLMLDEPANHLDPVYQRQIFSLIGDWLKRPGRAVISVVHDLSLARRYGTHALLMTGGRAVAQGPVEAVLTRDNLNQVYGMDLYRWMEELLDCWRQA
ncbi:MAG TPA: ABC transporter ATP-binding protein [Candidatus Excrementavichristensenella intestinipullorum]|nr:ABC transporter ATP-binding protein [Candidatus Excrementavichristensenella intestinipullorum]